MQSGAGLCALLDRVVPLESWLILEGHAYQKRQMATFGAKSLQVWHGDALCKVLQRHRHGADTIQLRGPRRPASALQRPRFEVLHAVRPSPSVPGYQSKWLVMNE